MRSMIEHEATLLYSALVVVLALLAFVVCLVVLLVKIIRRKKKKTAVFALVNSFVVLIGFYSFYAFVVGVRERAELETRTESEFTWTYMSSFINAYSLSPLQRQSVIYLDADGGSIISSALEYMLYSRNINEAFMLCLTEALNPIPRDSKTRTIYGYFQRSPDDSSYILNYDEVENTIHIEFIDMSGQRGRQGVFTLDPETRIMRFAGGNESNTMNILYLYHAYRTFLNDIPVDEERLQTMGVSVASVRRKAALLQSGGRDRWDLVWDSLFFDIQNYCGYNRQTSAILTNVMLSYINRELL